MTDLLTTHDKQKLAAQREMLERHAEDRLWAEVYARELTHSANSTYARSRADEAVEFLRKSRNQR